MTVLVKENKEFLPVAGQEPTVAEKLPAFNIRDFIRDQAQKVKEGGFLTFIAKVCKIPLYLIAVPLVVSIRLTSRWFLIRMGELRSERIGHFAFNTAIYLCEKESQKTSRLGIDLFYHRSSISNYQLKKMWARSGKIFAHPLVKFLHLVNKTIPGGEPFNIVTPARDPFGLLSSREPFLTFTEEEERLAESELIKMGVPAKAPFVCFYARDPNYLCAIAPKVNWSYHNHRDTDANDMRPAMKAMKAKGYYALRMGAIVGKKIDVDDSHIIDYAFLHRTDFMDIYLTAKCRFFIGVTAGLASVPEIFRRPIAWVDYIPLEDMYAGYRDSLFIFKKLWLRKEKRFMTFPEIIRSGAGRYYNAEFYEKDGIDVINNSPEEILSLAVEMDERLNGTWRCSKEDEELQKRFWSLFQPNDFNQVYTARAGTEFLRQNRSLLEI